MPCAGTFVPESYRDLNASCILLISYPSQPQSGAVPEAGMVTVRRPFPQQWPCGAR